MDSLSARPRISRLVRGLAICLAVVVSGLGLAILWSDYAAERMTRFGLASALHGSDARQFGSTLLLAGLLPLMLLARTPRAAAWIGSLLGTALLLNVFFGARLWA